MNGWSPSRSIGNNNAELASSNQKKLCMTQNQKPPDVNVMVLAGTSEGRRLNCANAIAGLLVRHQRNPG